MTVEQTRAIIEPYARSHDARYVAEDAVFTDMTTGQRHEGREAIAAMLQHVYHVAFDARAEPVSLTIGEGTAALEATFSGRHVGEFAGVPATGREVRVPLCVTYEVAGDGIKRARIYLLASAMLQQPGTAPAASP